MDEKQKTIPERIAIVNSLRDLQVLFDREILQYNDGDLALIERAYKLAQDKHQGQVRDEGTPYFTHCLGTAINAMETNAPSRVVCAALLHDTLEDTDLSIETLRAQFGDDIARLVHTVSKRVNGGEKMPAAEYYAKIRENPEACTLKGCDRLSNLFSLPFSPDDKRMRYIEETRREIIPLVSLHHPALAQRLLDTIQYLESQG